MFYIETSVTHQALRSHPRPWRQPCGTTAQTCSILDTLCRNVSPTPIATPHPRNSPPVEQSDSLQISLARSRDAQGSMPQISCATSQTKDHHGTCGRVSAVILLVIIFSPHFTIPCWPPSNESVRRELAQDHDLQVNMPARIPTRLRLPAPAASTTRPRTNGCDDPIRVCCQESERPTSLFSRMHTDRERIVSAINNSSSDCRGLTACGPFAPTNLAVVL